MLRTWFYAATIITLRTVVIISASVLPSAGGFHRAMPCDRFSSSSITKLISRKRSPPVLPFGGTSNGWVTVEANFWANGATFGAALGLSFGIAGWLALTLHAVGVEIYLRVTPRKSNRLRNVSYQRQIEGKMKHPGSAGLTSDRLGNADMWQRASQSTDGAKMEQNASPTN